MPATARAAFSRSGARSPSSATPFSSAMNGSPTPRCTNNLPPNGRPHDQARHAVPTPLALLHRAQIRGDRRRGAARLLCRVPVDVSSAMGRERLYLFDTTLRDGAQTNGVDFTLADKLAIAGRSEAPRD